jgi:hypothetical protein
MTRHFAFNLGTIKASSIQPNMLGVNNFHKGHSRCPIAFGDPVARVRKGLVASQVTLTPTLMRVPLPSEIVRRVLTRAEVEHIKIHMLTTYYVPRPNIELLRA